MQRRWLFIGLMLCLAGHAPADSDWKLAREDTLRSIRVYTRALPDSSYDELRSEVTVPQSVDTVVAVLSDIPAWPEWLARIRKVKRLRQDGDTHWVYVVYKLPYPFIDRDTVLQSRLTRDAATGAVMIRSLAVRNVALPEQDNRRVHLYDLESTWRLTPLSSGGTRIELTGRGEPGGYMPALIFNYNLADEPLQSLRLLRQMLLRPKYLKSAAPLHAKPVTKTH